MAQLAATSYLQELISQGSANKLKSAYVGLWTNDPTVAGLLTGEVVGGGYVRLLVPWDPGQALLTTDTTIAWGQATADWGFVSHVILCDTATAGNVLAYEALASAVEVPSGSTVTIATGNLSVVIT